MTAKLLVVECRDVIRAGLESFLSGTDIEILAAVSGGKDAVRTALEHGPDVVLLGLPADEDGLPALQRLGEKLPGVPVVMLVAGESLTYVARAIGAGPPGRFPRAAAASICFRDSALPRQAATPGRRSKCDVSAAPGVAGRRRLAADPARVAGPAAIGVGAAQS